jgi:hypothetical protein
MWPRLRLTPEEAQYVSKYASMSKPGSPGKPGVVRRMYPGTLIIDATNRTPSYQFGIARRCRVFGIALAGDLNCFDLQFTDTAGEVFQITPVTSPHFQAGPNDLPFGTYGSPPVAGPVFPGHVSGPGVFEPNILLLPNQTLTVLGQAVADATVIPEARIDFTLFVWEFPGMKGSPIRQ